MGVNKRIMKTFAALRRIETLILMALALTNCVIVVPGSIRGDRMSALGEIFRGCPFFRLWLHSLHACPRTMRQIDEIISARSSYAKISAVSFLVAFNTAVRLSVSWMLLNVFVTGQRLPRKKLPESGFIMILVILKGTSLRRNEILV